MPLTKRQSEILSYLQGHILEQGYAPSFEEIAEHFGFQQGIHPPVIQREPVNRGSAPSRNLLGQ